MAIQVLGLQDVRVGDGSRADDEEGAVKVVSLEEVQEV